MLVFPQHINTGRRLRGDHAAHAEGVSYFFFLSFIVTLFYSCFYSWFYGVFAYTQVLFHPCPYFCATFLIFSLSLCMFDYLPTIQPSSPSNSVP
jgi:hypothetical protein